jgi:tetratricopeptide (TPR) repeat protein
MRKLFILFLFASCVSSTPTKVPNDHEWSLIDADYQWLQTLRKAQPAPPPNATRKQQIETLLVNHTKIEPTYIAFTDKLDEYYKRTADPRAAAMFAREKIALGDEYMGVLSRYDRAIELYREALRYEPQNPDALRKIGEAEQRRFVSMTAFAMVKTAMKEDEVQKMVGMPREDWIKQVVQNNRVYSVWIYPKSDGGASAIYFDNGVVYHTNWNAAAPQPPAAQATK